MWKSPNCQLIWVCCIVCGIWIRKDVHCKAIWIRWLRVRSLRRWKSLAISSRFTKTQSHMRAWNWWSLANKASEKQAYWSCFVKCIQIKIGKFSAIIGPNGWAPMSQPIQRRKTTIFQRSVWILATWFVKKGRRTPVLCSGQWCSALGISEDRKSTLTYLSILTEQWHWRWLHLQVLCDTSVFSVETKFVFGRLEDWRRQKRFDRSITMAGKYSSTSTELTSAHCWNTSR